MKHTGEMYSKICVELNGPLAILVLVWRKSIHFWRRYERKQFPQFRPQWPWTCRTQICSLHCPAMCFY